MPADKTAADAACVYEVLDFFERIGTFTDYGAMHRELIWADFVYWLVGYWTCATAILEKKRELDNDPSLWEWSEALIYELGPVDRYHVTYSEWLHRRPKWRHNHRRFPHALFCLFVRLHYRVLAYTAVNVGAKMYVSEEQFLNEEANLRP